MKEIPLTQGKFALVDDEDYERLSKFNWLYLKKGNTVSRGFCEAGEHRHIPLACEVLLLEVLIDHKDNNPLNNQKANLRLCTYSQNCQNRRKRRGCSSIYKGVSFHKQKKKWSSQIAQLNIFGQTFTLYLGHFLTEEEAAKVYDEAARKHFGEFARLNFPQEGEQGCL